MTRKPRAFSSASSPGRAKRSRSSIPNAFLRVSSATVTSNAAKIEVPMLVIYGEWLKTIGFPDRIDHAADDGRVRRDGVAADRGSGAAQAQGSGDAAVETFALLFVVPAEAGIQLLLALKAKWIPAFAGMTVGGRGCR